MSKQTIEILTNKEIIALDQDPLVYQARRLKDLGDLEVWAKPLISTTSGKVAVALLNRSDKPSSIAFDVDSIGLDAAKGYTMKDLWDNKRYPSSAKKDISFEVPPHGIVVLRLTGTARPYNIFQSK